MKLCFRLCLFIFALVCFNTAYCVPADPRPHTIIQPNGKTLTYYLKGDEHLHWFESLDGYTLLKNEDGDLEFACVDDKGILQPSGILACNQEERDEIELSFLATIKPKLFFSKEQVTSIRNL